METGSPAPGFERPTRILVTGARGFLGNLICRHLSKSPEKYEVLALDRSLAFSRRVPPGERTPPPGVLFQSIDLACKSDVGRILDRVDVVLHFAATPDLDAPVLPLLKDLWCTAILYREVLKSSVRGVVFASSAATLAGHSGADFFVGPRSSARPTTFYALTKLACERLGRLLYRRGRTAICLRLGAISPDDAPPNHPFWKHAWCSKADLLRAVERGISAVAKEEPSFHLHLAVSKAGESRIDSTGFMEWLTGAERA